MSERFYDRKSTLREDNLAEADLERGTTRWILGTMAALLVLVGVVFLFTGRGESISTASSIDRGTVSAPASTTGSGSVR